MRDMVSIVRLLGSVAEYNPEQKDEATLLSKAIMKGDTDLTVKIEVRSGEVRNILICDMEHHAFERRKKTDTTEQ